MVNRQLLTDQLGLHVHALFCHAGGHVWLTQQSSSDSCKTLDYSTWSLNSRPHWKGDMPPSTWALLLLWKGRNSWTHIPNMSICCSNLERAEGRIWRNKAPGKNLVNEAVVIWFFDEIFSEEATILTVTLWHIWEAKNGVREGQRQLHPHCIVQKIQAYAEWFCCIFTNPSIPIGVTLPVLNDGLHRRKDGWKYKVNEI
jgi:hypothetical protein